MEDKPEKRNRATGEMRSRSIEEHDATIAIQFSRQGLKCLKQMAKALKREHLDWKQHPLDRITDGKPQSVSNAIADLMIVADATRQIKTEGWSEAREALASFYSLLEDETAFTIVKSPKRQTVRQQSRLCLRLKT